MELKTLHKTLLCFLSLLFSAQLYALDINDPRQALEAYVNQDDGKFSYQHLASIPAAGLTLHLYNMVSQEWRSSDEIDRTLWQHQMVIAVPDTVISTTGMLFVGDNDNTDPLPGASEVIVQIISQLAIGSQTIVSAVYQVPNQPFFFPGESAGRKEDSLVGYSWDKYLDTGDTTWPVHVPMTKAVIKAMDAVQQIAPALGAYQVDDFVITGYSKRGLVTWLAAAIDARVIAIAPGVIDFLNVAPSLENQYRSYGAFIEEFSSLLQLEVLQRLRSPEFRDLASIIDPYEYRDRLSLPKLILNSSGDQFFLPDSARFYYADLPGEKLMRYAPNTDHSLENSVTSVFDTLYSLLGWYQTVLFDLPRPELHWEVQNDELIASATLPPQRVRVWRATNPLARDFRKVSIGEAWTEEVIAPDANGQYRTTLPQPASGYAATYIEFVYAGPTGLPMTFSTQVYITPETYPFTLDIKPVLEPQLARYWKQQVELALTTNDGAVDLQTLETYLPLAVFDDHVSTMNELDNVLSYSGQTRPLEKFASSQCISTRLNISHGQFGWYSDVDLGFLGSGKLWEYYALADSVEALGFPWLAGLVCQRLNLQ
ncbi:MAG: PhoPQ-activated protein PqaA family protein [Gammaproteobacteria bacterium]